MSFELIATRVPTEQMALQHASQRRSMLPHFLGVLTRLAVSPNHTSAECLVATADNHNDIANAASLPYMVTATGLPGIARVGMHGMVYEDVYHRESRGRAVSKSFVSVRTNTCPSNELTNINRIHTILETVGRQMAYGMLQLFEDPASGSLCVSRELTQDEFTHTVQLPSRQELLFALRPQYISY